MIRIMLLACAGAAFYQLILRVPECTYNRVMAEAQVSALDPFWGQWDTMRQRIRLAKLPHCDEWQALNMVDGWEREAPKRYHYDFNPPKATPKKETAL